MICHNYHQPQSEAMNRMKKEHPYDLRADERVATIVEVICRPYTSTGNVRSAKGVMRNFSSQGSYIETDLKFNSGTILIVRMVGCLPTPSSAESSEKPRSICLGEIKWRQNLMDEEDGRYGMGLRYLD
jgi:hypothetical protein